MFSPLAPNDSQHLEKKIKLNKKEKKAEYERNLAMLKRWWLGFTNAHTVCEKNTKILDNIHKNITAPFYITLYPCF